MVSLVDAFGLGLILLVNTAIAALLTRFLRVRLHTEWGSILYSLFFCTVAILASTLLLSGVFNLGPDLGSAAAVFSIVVFLPMATGITIDYFWMPAPDEVDLPEKWDEDRDRERERRNERLRP